MDITKASVEGMNYYPGGHDQQRSKHSFYQKELSPLFINPIPIWKRTLDIVCSLVLLMLLSPLFLSISILVKIVSPGPVLFKQKRVGIGGKLFTCYKFRTMKVDADFREHQQYLTELIFNCQDSRCSGTPMEKLSKDPRIIPVGKLLRASGFDELPQLINILIGQMSLVGPRPPIPYEVREYKLWYKERFDVMPGLTGLWQISGKNKLGFNEMIRLDIQYAMRRSPLLDFIILIKTPYTVFLQIKEIKNGHN